MCAVKSNARVSQRKGSGSSAQLGFGHTMKQVDIVKIVAVLLVGVIFGVVLLSSVQLDSTMVFIYLSLLLLVCILALVVDIRSILLSRE